MLRSLILEEKQQSFDIKIDTEDSQKPKAEEAKEEKKEKPSQNLITKVQSTQRKVRQFATEDLFERVLSAESEAHQKTGIITCHFNQNQQSASKIKTEAQMPRAFNTKNTMAIIKKGQAHKRPTMQLLDQQAEPQVFTPVSTTKKIILPTSPLHRL